MKTIVVYQSGTGFTAQYAQWIAQALSCEAFGIKEVSAEQAGQADCVIYGGYVMAGGVSGLDRMRKMSPKRLIVFAVGYTPAQMMDQAAMKEQNHIGSTPFFYFTGGMRPQKLNFVLRGMLSMLKKSVEKKENKTPQEQYMAEHLGAETDLTDRNQIEPLVQLVRGL